MNNKQTIVITDLDGTLTKKSLVLEHCGFLESKGIINTNGAYTNWKKDMKNEKLIVECAISYQSCLVGKTLEEMEVEKFCKEFLHNENNWYDTINQMEGRESHILSGSADFLVTGICKQFNKIEQFERVQGIGSKYEIINGFFTGKITVPMFSADRKQLEINKIVESRNLHIIGMGDTLSDLPILEVADYSILVEPTEETMREVLKKKVKISEMV